LLPIWQAQTYEKTIESGGRNKPDFSSFMEIFRYSRTDCIMECADVLKDLGYNTDDSLVIELYLKRLRSERNKLMQRLVGSLQ
jgi:hypothetical protein